MKGISLILLWLVTMFAALEGGVMAQDSRAREARLLIISEQLIGASYSSLSQAQKVFFCVWDLEAEVNNGGFHQYFFNTSGENARDAESALKLIGAAQTALIVKAAIARINGGQVPTNLEQRRKLMVSLSEDRFEDVDAAFLAYPDDLSSLLFAYVQSHNADFKSRP